MKKIEAVIKPFKLEDVKDALQEAASTLRSGDVLTTIGQLKSSEQIGPITPEVLKEKILPLVRKLQG